MEFRINNAVFSCLVSDDCGGSIHLSPSVSAKIYIEECSFKNSVSHSSGGAIYSDGEHSNYFLKKICGFNCSSEDYYSFSYTSVKCKATSYINRISDSSVSQCISDADELIRQEFGENIVKKVNVSFNENGAYTGLSQDGSNNDSIEYTLISNNTGEMCLFFQFNYEIISNIKFCDILFNTVTNKEAVLISINSWDDSNDWIVIEYSSIMFNSAPNIIGNEGVSLVGCSIDFEFSKGVSNRPASCFTNNLRLIKNEKCKIKIISCRVGNNGHQNRSTIMLIAQSILLLL